MNPDAAVVVDVLEAVFAATNNYHRAARALRNRLLIMTVVALVAAITLVLTQARVPRVGMISAPAGVDNVAPWQLLLIVMTFGAVGALLTTIRPISTMPPSFTPFNFPLQQALLKIAVGTLTAAVGVIGLNAATATDDLGLATLLVAAAAFGAAQQSVTRMLDDRATALIKTSPSAPTAA